MIKVVNPTSPGLRGKIIYKRKLSKSKVKKLCKGLKNCSGRNNKGRITTRHKGGGLKKKYRIINFNYNKNFIKKQVISIEHDPNRNCSIMLTNYSDGEKCYIPFIKGVKIGDILVTANKSEIKEGNSMMIKNIPIGYKICLLQLEKNKKITTIRSAGGFAKIKYKFNNYCIVKLKSNELRKINNECFATIGSIGDDEYIKTKKGKAGIKRLKGIRPTVRGVAMNPIDHPHGGGEGKTTTKRHQVSYLGKKTIGLKTKKNKRFAKLIIKRRNEK